MKNKGERTTFWNFILNNNIEIPIIQRDYAQGRKGKAELRKKFISDLKQALQEKRVLVLDFIYASIENGAVNPLDGQQRLTTLWLLHWYIAYRADKLHEKIDGATVRDVLKKFSYETRISSREFIEKLCDYNNTTEIGGLVPDIKNQTWFYSEWEQDPTIQSMLTTLGGNKEKDSNGSEIIGDGFEEAFTQDDTFAKYWESLIRDKIIVFYYLPLNDFGLSDDLYIKMNARGKALTSFENFKADLVGYIHKQAEKNPNWEDLIEVKEGIPIKLDTAWTDIFWKNHSHAGNIDDIYYAFINRYLLNAFIIHSGKSAEDIEKDSCFAYLYGEKSNDIYIKYTSFDKYKAVLKTNKKVLEKLAATLNNISQYIKDFTREKFNAFNANVSTPTWDKDSKFRFIPEYVDDVSITTVTQSQRVIFWAICKYFETNEYNEAKFADWMRVAWNIVENANIDTVSAMIGALRLINELGEKSGDILYFLADQTFQIKSDAAKEQVAEEREKAKQILTDDKTVFRGYIGNITDEQDNRLQLWKDAIIQAERYAFFRGSIRFLFKNSNGGWDWSDFDCKWWNVKKIFNKNGLEKEYKTEAKANRIILSYCNKWVDQIESFTHNDKYIFGYRGETWKNNILLKSIYAEPVHHLLTGDGINDMIKLNDSDELREVAFERLVHSNIIGWVHSKDKSEKYYIRWINSGLSLYPSSEGVILTNKKRDSILSALAKEGRIELDEDSIINSGKDVFFRGWSIKFKVSRCNNDISFAWQHWNRIDMYDGNQRLCQLPNYEGLTIDSKDIDKQEELINKMEDCIKRYGDIKSHGALNG